MHFIHVASQNSASRYHRMVRTSDLDSGVICMYTPSTYSTLFMYSHIHELASRALTYIGTVEVMRLSWQLSSLW